MLVFLLLTFAAAAGAAGHDLFPAHESGEFGGTNMYSLTVGPPSALTGVSNSGPARKLALLPNAPNPFNPYTTIRFFVPKEAGTRSRATLHILDLTGRFVATVLDGVVPAGYCTTT